MKNRIFRNLYYALTKGSTPEKPLKDSELP